MAVDSTGLQTNTVIGPGSDTPNVVPPSPTKDVGQIPFQDAQNPLIVTSKNFQTGLNQGSTALDSSLRNINPNYPYPAPPPVAPPADTKTTDNADFNDGFTKQLDAIANSSNDSTKSLIASIHAARANQQGALDQKYEMYSRGLQLLGVEKGTAAATPELLAGQLQSAENEHQQKISDLVAKETKAVMDAQQARDDNNLKLVKDKMDYVASIQKQKATALKDYYDTITSGNKAAEGIAPSIAANVMALDPSQREAYLSSVATSYKVPVDSLVSAVAAYQSTQSKEALSEANIRSQIANRGANSAAAKPLTPSALTALKKQNPLIDLPYGTTSAEAQQAVIDANAFKSIVAKDFADPNSGALVNGLYSYDYVKKALSALPNGVSRTGFLDTIKDKLGLGKFKNAKQYGITQSEFDTLTGK